MKNDDGIIEEKQAAYDRAVKAARAAYVMGNPLMVAFNEALDAYKAAAARAEVARAAAQAAQHDEDLAIEKVAEAALKASCRDALSDERVCAICEAQVAANNAELAYMRAKEARLEAEADAVAAAMQGDPFGPNIVTNAKEAETAAFKAHQDALVAVGSAVKATISDA